MAEQARALCRIQRASKKIRLAAATPLAHLRGHRLKVDRLPDHQPIPRHLLASASASAAVVVGHETTLCRRNDRGEAVVEDPVK